jgi:hypothetical protein
MSRGAAEVLAQVIVGLIIAMMLEGQRVVATTGNSTKKLAQSIRADDWLRTLSQRRPAVVSYLCLFLVSGLASAVSMSLCLKSVMSGAAVTSAGAGIVTASLALQIFLVVVRPTGRAGESLDVTSGREPGSIGAATRPKAESSSQTCGLAASWPKEEEWSFWSTW